MTESMTAPIRLYMSMSLDGFIAGPDDRAGQELDFTPLGARTTGCPSTRPRTRTATSGSWSSTWP
jgi:hypothetical protein